MRLYYKPLVLLIWLGAVVMMLGGALSLSDRRLRVGAPKPGGRNPRCSRRSRAMRRIAAHRLADRARCAGRRVRRDAGRDAEGPGAGGARARICRKSCAAWSARTSRSTIRKRRLAHDLRVLVRERLEAGDSDKQVLDFLVARYGEFVLLKPPVRTAHAAAVGAAAAGSARRRDRAICAGAAARNRRLGARGAERGGAAQACDFGRIRP